MSKKPLLMTMLLAAALLLSACAPQAAVTPSAAPTAQAPAETPALQATLEAAPQEGTPAPQAEYHSMTPQEAKARMDSGDDLLVVDVRTPAEYAQGHIPGALLVPNETIGAAPPELLPDLHQEILVYCRSGNRSRQAALQMIDLGYTNVYDFGGIIDWPYEVVKP